MVKNHCGKMRIAFVTLGCKLNYAETSSYERAFVNAGAEVVPWTAGADIFVVNTCSVTEHSDKKSRNIIRKLHRQNPLAQIIVTGCYAQLKREEIEGIEGVTKVFGANEKAFLVRQVLDGLDGTTSEDADCGHATFFPAYSSGERTRSFLKVQDGCDYKCAYCTVPYARGESRNIPISQVVAQAREIASKGIKEIVITGVNTGDFGKSTGESFFELLKQLNQVEGIERYRISSIEPNLLTEEIIDWIASGTKFLPHFHIPLQSGSDTILKEMGRRYDTETFARKIDYVRQKMERPGSPKVFLGIDVIVGFPGESEELFRQTYDFLKDRIRPAFIHIFPYSRRKGTPAAERKDQVMDSLKTERVAALEGLCDKLHTEFLAANRGIRDNVLIECRHKDGTMSGYTGNYIRKILPWEEGSIGKIIEVEI